jgi:hypothetical protein
MSDERVQHEAPQPIDESQIGDLPVAPMADSDESAVKGGTASLTNTVLQKNTTANQGNPAVLDALS